MCVCVSWLVVALSSGTRLPFTLLIHPSVSPHSPLLQVPPPTSRSTPDTGTHTYKVSPPKSLCATNSRSLHRPLLPSSSPITSTPKFLLSLGLCPLINYSSVPSRLGSASTTETGDGQLSLTSYIQTKTKKGQTSSLMAALVQSL